MRNFPKLALMVVGLMAATVRLGPKVAVDQAKTELAFSWLAV
jgi:hypothetical protein